MQPDLFSVFEFHSTGMSEIGKEKPNPFYSSPATGVFDLKFLEVNWKTLTCWIQSGWLCDVNLSESMN